MNRHQDNLSIYMANPLSTVCQLVIQEKAAKYVKQEAMAAIKFTDRHILLPSDRDGYMHLYLYTLGGQLKRQVTSGKFEVTDVYGYDEATGDVYYAANTLGPQDKQVYVTHQNGKTERLTAKEGHNNATFSKNYKYFINSWSDKDTPRRIYPQQQLRQAARHADRQQGA